jgi:hypothetical protein
MSRTMEVDCNVALLIFGCTPTGKTGWLPHTDVTVRVAAGKKPLVNGLPPCLHSALRARMGLTWQNMHGLSDVFNLLRPAQYLGSVCQMDIKISDFLCHTKKC